MATKPIVQPELWASNAVYTTGPFIGSPGKVVPGGPVAAEGHRPGSAFPTPAEYENSQQNRITDLVRWVFLGSSAGAADAHIVETDTSGRATLHGLTVDDSADETALVVFGSGATTAAATIENSGGGGGVSVDIGSAAATAYHSALTGDNLGLELTMADDSVAIAITADGTATSTAVTILQGGAGRGIEVVGGSGNTAIEATAGAGQIAVDAIANATSVHAIRGLGGLLRAVYGVGLGAGLGGEFLGGTTAPTGMRSTGGSATAYGVHGRTDAAGGASSAGVYGEGRGAAAVGVLAESPAGRALVVMGDTTNPAYAAMRIVPQDNDPSAGVFDGEVYWSANHKTLRTCVAGYGFRSMPTMGPGSAFILNATQPHDDEQPTGGSFNPASPFLTVMCDTANGTGFYGGSGAEMVITFTGDIRLGTNVADYFEVQFYDFTNGAPIATWEGSGNLPANGFYQTDTSLNYSRSITASCRYSPGSDGDVEIRVLIAHAGSTQYIRNGCVTVMGTFDV